MAGYALTAVPKERRWLEQRCDELLPVPYFHIVFTVPEELNPLALANPKWFYDLLFDSASKTLLEIAADPKHLGAKIGVLAVLHTWSQTLLLHPHLHCIVPGGGLSLDRQRWIASQEDFFLPIQVLARLFRGKFLATVKDAWKEGRFVTDHAKFPPCDQLKIPPPPRKRRSRWKS